MNFLRPLLDNPIAQQWSPQTRETYLAFTQRLLHNHPLSIKVGKGGLSYYKQTRRDLVFVCHFNATPQAQNEELGFADFRLDALRGRLNLSVALRALRKAASDDMHFKVSKLWCSLHFPLWRSSQVADLFRQHIIVKVK